MASNLHKHMVVYLVLLVGAHAFFLYGLFHNLKSGRGGKGILAPIILLTCSAAFGAPAVIRMWPYDIVGVGQFEAVSFLGAGALLVLALSIYGPALLSTVRPAKTAEWLRRRKIFQVTVLVLGVTAAAGLLFAAVMVLVDT